MSQTVRTFNESIRPILIPLESVVLSPAWVKFMEFCARLGHGEIEKVKIQDGVPVLAEKVTEKTKFA